MRSDINERVVLVGLYINSSNDTIRETAKVFGMSKSTVHVDVSKRLKKVNPKLYEKVKKVLNKNFEEKHIRGGEATRKKYLEK